MEARGFSLFNWFCRLKYYREGEKGARDGKREWWDL
jgi:hypothetical protein